MAVSYACKTFMKLTTGLNIIPVLFFVTDASVNKLECMLLTGSQASLIFAPLQGILKGEVSITVPLTSYLTGLV